MVWPSVRLRYKKALLMWVSRMRCAASTSHPRIWSQFTYWNKTKKLLSIWIMTFNFESGQLCGFSDFWCYWENDPILTHNFKLRGSTTKSEKFGCWICPNFPKVFLLGCKAKGKLSSKVGNISKVGWVHKQHHAKNKRWNEEQYQDVTCIHW